jgi:hypothetical protein
MYWLPRRITLYTTIYINTDIHEYTHELTHIGSDISIPSVLIGQDDGAFIRDFMKFRVTVCVCVCVCVCVNFYNYHHNIRDTHLSHRNYKNTTVKPL